VPLQPLLDAFERKVRASLQLLESEAAALTRAPLSIGPITVACALGYMDYRFDALGWRALAPRLAHWHEEITNRHSFQATAPMDD
jgi:glutathione S-transferase